MQTARKQPHGWLHTLLSQEKNRVWSAHLIHKLFKEDTLSINTPFWPIVMWRTDAISSTHSLMQTLGIPSEVKNERSPSEMVQARRFNDRVFLDIVFKNVNGVTFSYLNILDDARPFQVLDHLPDRSETVLCFTSWWMAGSCILVLRCLWWWMPRVHCEGIHSVWHSRCTLAAGQVWEAR